MSEFSRAKLNGRAVIAVAYLRDVVETARGREAVHHVKRYVEELRRDPLRPFLPIPEK